ncbi:adenosine deaminase [Streptococcus minor]|uniref:adenosine deaminase n=1 Tax=Streptococcus minor TaxID=229549 RepID=UPI0003740866
MSMTDFYKQLAKTELHCHLDGSLSMEVIRELAKMAAIYLPDSDEELKSLITAPSQTESLIDYLKTFDFVRPLLQTKEALQLAAYDVARQAALENVIYIEIRFAPELSMDKNLSARETVEAVLVGLQQAQEEFGIVAKALVCGMRQSDPALTYDILSNIVEFAPQGLVGFDFAGDEHGFPPRHIEKLIRKVQELGYPMTLHAGECGCPNHIADTLKLGIKRMGHVTAIHDQPELIQEFIHQGATAELCLTSNLQTKAAKTIEEFPYLALTSAGAKITINTDNRTVSDTSLTREYHLFRNHFGTTTSDFLAFNQNALHAAFCTSSEKDFLLEKLAKLYAPFL